LCEQRFILEKFIDNNISL